MRGKIYRYVYVSPVPSWPSLTPRYRAGQFHAFTCLFARTLSLPGSLGSLDRFLRGVSILFSFLFPLIFHQFSLLFLLRVSLFFSLFHPIFFLWFFTSGFLCFFCGLLSFYSLILFLCQLLSIFFLLNTCLLFITTNLKFIENTWSIFLIYVGHFLNKHVQFKKTWVWTHFWMHSNTFTNTCYKVFK